MMNNVGRESVMEVADDGTVRSGYLWYLPLTIPDGDGDDEGEDESSLLHRIYSKDARKSYFSITGPDELRWRETKHKSSPIRGGLKFTSVRQVNYGVVTGEIDLDGKNKLEW